MGRERQRRNSALTLGCPLQQTGQWGRGGGEHPRLRGVHSSPLANRTERNRHKGSLQPPALDASWWGWAGASCPSWAEGWDCIQNRTAWDPIKKKKKNTAGAHCGDRHNAGGASATTSAGPRHHLQRVLTRREAGLSHSHHIRWCSAPRGGEAET